MSALQPPIPRFLAETGDFSAEPKGINGKEFVIFKFRTMTVQGPGSAIVQATRVDARVTPIGRLLRSVSIDELPQILNV